MKTYKSKYQRTIENLRSVQGPPPREIDDEELAELDGLDYDDLDGLELAE